MKFTAVIIILLLFASACSNNSGTTRNMKDEVQLGRELNKPDVENERNAPQQVQDKKEEQQQIKTGEPTKDWDKKIIKIASLNLEVTDFKSFTIQAKELTKKYGGYTSSEQQDQNDYRIQNVLSIKVPVGEFDNLMNELSASKGIIKEKKINSEDVTTEVIDTKSRIEAKKQVRNRYLELLKQAKNMEEILNVQNEINQIQEEIEMATGRVDYLSHASAMSTINLTYFEVLNPGAADPSSPSFSMSIRHAFNESLNVIKDLVLFLITIWPLILAAVVGVYLFKRHRKSSVKAEIQTPS